MKDIEHGIKPNRNRLVCEATLNAFEQVAELEACVRNKVIKALNELAELETNIEFARMKRKYPRNADAQVGG